MAKFPSPRLDSILLGRDGNIAENYDTVNTIPTQHILAGLHMGNCLCHSILQNAGETSVRIDIVYVYHVFVAYHLTGLQVGIFIGENDFPSFVLQEITAFMSENVYMQK